MRITRIDYHVLLDPSYDAEATRSAQDDFVVELHRDARLAGVGYAWDSVDRALDVLAARERFDLVFVEMPRPSDDLDCYAELARRSPVPIDAGEGLATRHEFAELLDRGGVAVTQPDESRPGTLAVAEAANRRERDRSRRVDGGA